MSEVETKAVTKTEDGEQYPASAYLVVEKPDEPSTWHLRVRDAAGDVDNRLLGAAWAALHEGYRGNKYEGPGKAEAIAKLSKLRDAAGLAKPTEGKESEEDIDEDPDAEQQADQVEDETDEEATEEDTKGKETGWVAHLLRGLKAFAAEVRGTPADSLATSKAGARHSAADRADMQAVHDIAVKQGAACPLTVTKDAQGRHRWVLFSSTAYQDRDREIVSTKAQAEDIARLDAAGDYGVLRWWHAGRPVAAKEGAWETYQAGPGLDLGVCDFSALDGRIRVESGTFYDEAVGAALKEVADQLSVSLGFSHPLNEPSADGVFDHIHTFERSLLPKGRQSNLFADVPLITSEKERSMEDEKIAKLGELIGPELAQRTLAQAQATEKDADALGVKYKATDKIGEMTLEELKGFIEKCMAPSLDEMKSMLKGKDDASAKAANDLEHVLTAQKEALDLLKGLGEALQGVDTRLKAVEGDQPAFVKHGYRASAAAETVNPNITEKNAAEQKPLGSFLDYAMGKQAQPPVGGTPPVPATAA